MQVRKTFRALGFRLAAILLPLFLLFAIEGALRAAGVLENRRKVFVEVPGNPDYLVLNPDFGARYFLDFAPSVAFTPIRARKKPEAFRVLILGGSSAAGFPFRFTHSFPSLLQERLEAAALGQEIEVANLGMSAVNSYTLRDVARAAVRLNPDAVAIYAGHNEYYGAFGVGSTVGGLGANELVKRFALFMKRSVIYLLMEDLLAPRKQGADADETRTLMARVVGNATISLDDQTYLAGIDQFKRNMADVLGVFQKRDIPVYFGTLASNLAGQAPLGDDPAADSLFAQAQHLYDSDATAARGLFLRSKELDNVRFRAPEAINQAIRELANRFDAHVVETQSAILEKSTTGVEDRDLFTDHLHPNLTGYAILADAFFDAIARDPHLAHNPVVLAPPQIDPISEASAELNILRLTGGYPFVKNRGMEESNRLFSRILRERLQSTWTDSLGAVDFAARQATPQTLLEGVNRARAGADTLHALQLYETLLHWQPFNAALMKTAVGYALASPNFNSEVAALALYAANRTDDVYFYNALGICLLRSGDLQGAQAALSIAESYDPDSKEMLYNSARVFLQLGDTTTARDYFLRYRNNTPE